MLYYLLFTFLLLSPLSTDDVCCLQSSDLLDLLPYTFLSQCSFPFFLYLIVRFNSFFICIVQITTLCQGSLHNVETLHNHRDPAAATISREKNIRSFILLRSRRKVLKAYSIIFPICYSVCYVDNIIFHTNNLTVIVEIMSIMNESLLSLCPSDNGSFI